jgi:sterol desaturase/sphingolipid hydroxylase (fatty acid hydroxylase superfamily)
MEALFLKNELTVRFVAGLGILVLMGLLDFLRPHRTSPVPRAIRWKANLLLTIFNAIVVRIAFPAAAVGFAAYAYQSQLGLLNLIELPKWISYPLTILLMDLAIYVQHRVFHNYRPLWRIHRVHHTDRHLDFTSGARFHPIEILLSMAIKFVVIITIGAPMGAVILFEIILNGMSVFSHSNLKISRNIDALLRILFVTPGMHLIHHSQEVNETNSNYGFNLSIWDKIFNSYRENSIHPEKEMRIGLREFEDLVNSSKIEGLLALPFKQDP